MKNYSGLNVNVDRFSRLSLIALIFTVLFFKLTDTVADSDLYGHLKFGEDIWTQKEIPQTDNYSYLTQGQAWINHEWLSEVIFYLAYHHLGSQGLILLKVCLLFPIYLLLYRALICTGYQLVPTGLLLLIVCFLMMPGFVVIRPHLFSYLFFFLLFFIILKVEEKKQFWLLFLLPPLFVLWVNLHGGVLAGTAALLLWIVVRLGMLFIHRRTTFASREEPEAWPFHKTDGRRLDDTRPPITFDRERVPPLTVSVERGQPPDFSPCHFLDNKINNGNNWIPANLKIWVAVLFSFLGLLVNPYGLRMLSFLFQPATFYRPEITEWQPLQMLSVYFAGWFLFCVFIFYCWFRSHYNFPGRMFFAFGLMPVPFIAYRHGPLIAPSLALITAPLLLRVVPRFFRKSEDNKSSVTIRKGHQKWMLIANWVFIVIFVFQICHHNLPGIRIDPIRGENFPVQAVQAIKHYSLTGNMLVFFNWGEYVIWHLSPQIKVSIDGRRETVYSADIIEDNYDFLRGTADWENMLQIGEPQLILLPATAPVVEKLKKKPEWGLGYSDTQAVLFLKTSLAAKTIHSPEKIDPEITNGRKFFP